MQTPRVCISEAKRTVAASYEANPLNTRSLTIYSFSIMSCTDTERHCSVLTRSCSLESDSGFHHILSVDMYTSNGFLGLKCRNQWNMQVLNSVVVKVWHLYVLWLSR